MTYLYISVFLHGSPTHGCYHLANLWKSCGGWTKLKSLLPGGTTRVHVLIVSCKVPWVEAKVNDVMFRQHEVRASCRRFCCLCWQVIRLGSSKSRKPVWVLEVKQQPRKRHKFSSTQPFLICRVSGLLGILCSSLSFLRLSQLVPVLSWYLCVVCLCLMLRCVCFIPKLYKKFVLTIGQLP